MFICSVGTGYGLGQPTFYDWTLEPDLSREVSYQLPKELEDRIRIEMFSDKVTKALYSNRSDPIGLAKDSERYSLYSLLAREFGDLEVQLGPNVSGRSCHQSFWPHLVPLSTRERSFILRSPCSV